MAGSVLFNQTDFMNAGSKIVKEEIIDPLMKRGTKADFGRTGDHNHTDTNQTSGKQNATSEESQTSDENPAQEDEEARKSAFAPRQAVPAVTLFTPLPGMPQGGFKLDDGSKTQDFVPLIARSNASYLGWINRFNQIPQGSSTM